jgi:hypothetical protein
MKLQVSAEFHDRQCMKLQVSAEFYVRPVILLDHPNLEIKAFQVFAVFLFCMPIIQ